MDDYLVRRPNHSGGRDIEILSDTLHGRYIIKFIPRWREYRVHIFRGELIRLARKTPSNPQDRIWKDHHFAYDLAPRRSYERLIEVAKLAVTSLHYDFGAVDLLITRTNGRIDEPYVLEVNSAPGFTENRRTLEAYVGAIRRAENAERLEEQR